MKIKAKELLTGDVVLPVVKGGLRMVAHSVVLADKVVRCRMVRGGQNAMAVDACHDPEDVLDVERHAHIYSYKNCGCRHCVLGGKA